MVEDGRFVLSEEASMIGFDHPHGSAYVPKEKTPSSRRVKAAAAIGPFLGEMYQIAKIKKNNRHTRRKKAYNMVTQLLPQKCAPEQFRYSLEKLQEVSLLDFGLCYKQHNHLTSHEN